MSPMVKVHENLEVFHHFELGLNILEPLGREKTIVCILYRSLYPRHDIKEKKDFKCNIIYNREE